MSIKYFVNTTIHYVTSLTLLTERRKKKLAPKYSDTISDGGILALTDIVDNKIMLRIRLDPTAHENVKH